MIQDGQTKLLQPALHQVLGELRRGLSHGNSPVFHWVPVMILTAILSVVGQVGVVNVLHN